MPFHLGHHVHLGYYSHNILIFYFLAFYRYIIITNILGTFNQTLYSNQMDILFLFCFSHTRQFITVNSHQFYSFLYHLSISFQKQRVNPQIPGNKVCLHQPFNPMDFVSLEQSRDVILDL